MAINKIKKISESKDGKKRMVVIHTDQGSYTRHLVKENGSWWGVVLDGMKGRAKDISRKGKNNFAIVYIVNYSKLYNGASEMLGAA